MSPRQEGQPGPTDAERTSLAWSRTLIGFAAVIGLLAVRAAMLEAPNAMVVPLLIVSVTLLLVNGLATARTLGRARSDMVGGVRVIKTTPLLVTACAATAVALLSLALLPLGSL